MRMIALICKYPYNDCRAGDVKFMAESEFEGSKKALLEYFDRAPWLDEPAKKKLAK